MTTKSIIYLTFIIIGLVLSLGVVSASENINDTSLIGVDETPIDDLSSFTQNENVPLEEQGDEILSADEGSFSELQDLVDKAAAGSTIKLNKNYSYNDGISKKGVVIDKDLVIDGQNHVLNGKNSSGILHITSSNVVLKNIKFIDGNVTEPYYYYNGEFGYFKGDGSAVYMDYDSNLTVYNSSFENSFGGAIYSSAPDSNFILNIIAPIKYNTIEIYDSYFANNHAYEGSAVRGNIVKIYDSKFINNFAEGDAGAIYADFLTLDNSVFNNNSVYSGPLYSHYGYPYSGGSIFVMYDANISNSNFTNGRARYGGAIFAQYVTYYDDGEWKPFNSVINIENCLFENNYASDSGGAIFTRSFFNDENSTYNNNSAHMQGGAIYSNIFPMKLNNVIITNSNATYGGAISAAKVDQITNTKFDSNDAFFAKNILFGFANRDLIVDNDEIGQFIHHSNYTLVTDLEHFSTSILSDNYTVFFYYPSNSTYYYDGEIYPWVLSFEYYLEDSYSLIHPSALFVIADKSVINEPLQLLVNYYSEYYSDYGEKLAEPSRFYENKWEELKLYQLNKILSQFDLKVSGEIPDKGYSIRINDTTRLFIDFEVLQSELATTQYIKGPGYYRYWVPAFKVKYENVVENLTVEKNTTSSKAFVDDEITFEITVKNTGNEILNNVFIEDVDYTSNLLYLRYVNGTGNWIYTTEPILVSNADKTQTRNITSRWVLTTPLNVGENVTIKLIFEALNNGTARNNVTAGFESIELSKDSENITIYRPNLTVEKISNNPKANVGDLISFDIIVTNTGDCDLTNVWVHEFDYTGLTYDSYTGTKWIKNGDVYLLNGSLSVGGSELFTIFFKVYQPGNWTNTVIAGSNETDNKTANNTTEVVNRTETPKNVTDTPEDEPVFDDYARGPDENLTLDEDSPQQKSVAAKVEKNATGNPIFLILLVFLMGITTLRRRD